MMFPVVHKPSRLAVLGCIVFAVLLTLVASFAADRGATTVGAAANGHDVAASTTGGSCCGSGVDEPSSCRCSTQPTGACCCTRRRAEGQTTCSSDCRCGTRFDWVATRSSGRQRLGVCGPDFDVPRVRPEFAPFQATALEVPLESEPAGLDPPPPRGCMAIPC